MPIHDYKCVKCGKEEERLVKFSDAESQVCACEEESPMEIVNGTNPINFKLKGRWFGNGGY